MTKPQVRRRKGKRVAARAIIAISLLIPVAVWVAALRARITAHAPGGPAAGRAMHSAKGGAVRRVYAHSVVPGGVYDSAEVETARRRDAVVSAHYAGIGPRLHQVRLRTDMRAHVSYRVGKAVYWTRNRVRMPAGEMLLTDGGQLIRARCGNRISVEPRQPTLEREPTQQTLDTEEIVPEIAQITPPPEGSLPLAPVPGFVPGLPTYAAVKPPYAPDLPFAPPFVPIGPSGAVDNPSTPPVPGPEPQTDVPPEMPPSWDVPSGPPFLPPPQPVAPVPLEDDQPPLPPEPLPPVPIQPTPDQPTPPTPPKPSGGGGDSSVVPKPNPPAPPNPPTPPAPPVVPPVPYRPPSWLEPTDDPEEPFPPDEPEDPHATPEPATGVLLVMSSGLWWLSRRVCTLVGHARARASRRDRPARNTTSPGSQA